MFRFRECALLALCTLFVVGHCSDVTSPPVTITLTPPPNTSTSTTTPKPDNATTPLSTTSTTTTTPKPDNTTTPLSTTSTTTTTPKPDNTTTPPPTSSTNTTTPKPDTTTTTPSTTTTSTTPTPPPPPTTTPAPTPAPKPAPLPAPDQGTWSYTENNKTCIVIQFAAQLNVTYPKVVKNATVLADVLLNVPANATVSSGGCGDSNSTKQWLTLTWTANKTTTPNNMTFIFQRNDTTHNYALKTLNVTLTAELFPNASALNPIVMTHGTEWMTPVATSYRCAVPTHLNMTSESGSVASVTMSRLQEEAFRTGSGKAFSAARECGGGDVPDAVPIAVGCALGGLVVVVLIAYLVGRRRSAARGYLSM